MPISTIQQSDPVIYIYILFHIYIYILFIYLFSFLEPHPWHVEVPRLGVESELQLPACATATQDPSHICDLHHSSRQRQILNPLREARDQTLNLMVPSQIRFLCATTGTPQTTFLKLFHLQDSMVRSLNRIWTKQWSLRNNMGEESARELLNNNKLSLQVSNKSVN